MATASFLDSSVELSFGAAATTYADRDLQERVVLFIKQRQLARGANLKVLAHRGVVTLLGVVPTFHQRQLVLSLVQRVAGVVQIQDEIEVADFGDRQQALGSDGALTQVPADSRVLMRL